MWKQEELYGGVSVAPRLVLVCCGLKEPHATCKCYDEGLMGGNPTV